MLSADGKGWDVGNRLLRAGCVPGREHVVRKNRFGALLGAGLGRLLTRLQVDTIVVLGGICATTCVESTVGPAAKRAVRRTKVHVPTDTGAMCAGLPRPGATWPLPRRCGERRTRRSPP
ncbi:isochorismatase family protein [Phytohabitans kaempferiae]|uniref:Isochorismatase family protein n=1 Tax=Phytohabitans kaempferiae TaxID=1620943 RepID=A0ABV6M6W5_9ACTN